MSKICDDQQKGSGTKPRKPYRKPHLQVLGDLRSLTLGGSPGVNDSGSSSTYKPPPGGLPQPEGYPRPYEPPRP